jgi:hypothetical protein
MVFFAPFLAKKITDPLLTGEDCGDMLDARRGAALLKQKLQPSWAVRFVSPQTRRDYYRKTRGIYI